MTMSFEHVQRGFACAEEPLDAGYLDDIVRRRSARIAELFLKCFRRRLAASSVGLIELIEQLGDEPFEKVWSSALGQLRLALLTQPRDEHRALVAAASMAIHLAARGREVCFEVTLDRGETFRCGHHLLTASAGKLAFDRHEPLRGLASSRELVRVGTASHPVVLLPELPHATELPEGLALSPHDGAVIHAKYEAAYAILARCPHPYRAWVERAIHALVPVSARPGTTTSSSFEHLPGVVALSHESPAIAMADALVHEASHQHFYILTQLGPVDDGTDTKLYFSPARRAERPIDKILLAYHAFANILLFYRQCRAGGLADAELCESQENAYAACLADLQRPLETTRALTPLGRALFEPLAHRITVT